MRSLVHGLNVDLGSVDVVEGGDDVEKTIAGLRHDRTLIDALTDRLVWRRKCQIDQSRLLACRSFHSSVFRFFTCSLLVMLRLWRFVHQEVMELLKRHAIWNSLPQIDVVSDNNN
jgi:hypothetical protein